MSTDNLKIKPKYNKINQNIIGTLFAVVNRRKSLVSKDLRRAGRRAKP